LKTMRILAVSGSLRSASANTSTLMAAAVLAPPGVEIILYKGLGELPHFNPDLDAPDAPRTLPLAVQDLRREVGLCDGLLICSPEYAHGVAGSLKNALDWLVGSIEFGGKPVALFNAAPRAAHSDAQLREILATMSARLIEQASITVPVAGVGRHLDGNDIASDPGLALQIRKALNEFAGAISAAGSAAARRRNLLCL
jgi:NAD(P)H-dependent FMN reductase